MSGVSGMGWRPQGTSGLWVLAIVGAGIGAGLIAGLSEDPRDTRATVAQAVPSQDTQAATPLRDTPATTTAQEQPSPAQIVAMRFAAAQSLATNPVAAAVPPSAAKPQSGYVLASAESTQIFFNPNPTFAAHPSASAPPAAAVNSPAVAPQPAHAATVPSPAPSAPAPSASAPSVSPAVQTASRTTLPPALANTDAEVPAGALAYASPTADEPASTPSAAPAPKHPSVAAHPAMPSNQVLNSAQIASIKERLKLSAYQDQLWPP